MDSNTPQPAPDFSKLPQYQCHKVVRAARILLAICQYNPDHYTLDLEGFGSVPVTLDFYRQHRPVGGNWRDSYFVVYEDGYTSVSPAAAFEQGYTPVDQMVTIEPAAEPASWQDRVCEERQELWEKIHRLLLFLDGSQFASLAEGDQLRLRDQYNVMNEYLSILDSRISHFEVPA